MELKLKDFKAFCKGMRIEKLVNPVVNQLGGWDNAQDELRGVSSCSCGAAGGFGGFIYYSETVAFARKHRSEIVKSIEELADDLGEGVLEMVQNFNCIKGDYTTTEIGKALYGRYDEEYDYIYNALAWYALEEVAYEFAEWEYELERNEED